MIIYVSHIYQGKPENLERAKKINTIDLSRTEWENLIDECKTSKNATFILVCLTNLIKGDKIKLPLM